MRSMTGFGEATLERDGHFVSVEVSTVNSRHNNISINLSEFPDFVRRVEEAIRERVERGKVEVQFQSDMMGKRKETVRIDHDLVAFYANKAREISGDYNNFRDSLDASALFSLPGVVKTEKNAVLNEEVEELFLEALDSALDELVEMRKREGETISRDLKERTESIRDELDDIEERIPEALNRYRDKLLDRMDEILDLTGDETEERLEKELTMYADKCDISEEVVRVRSHLDQLESYLSTEDEPVGKSLEFLIQEIQREINTVGAKANDAQISQKAVDVKTELEKCREQIKNVE